MVRAPALLIVLLAFAATAPVASAAVIPGVKAGDSVLFAVDAGSGELKPTKKADRYVLTLQDVDRRATWFADRPKRDAGQVPSKRLFGSWARLGFAKEPPNAALAISGARTKRDTMAFELRLRSYKPKTRTATFRARRIGVLGTALRHLNQRLDERVARRFDSASLFIDNVSEGQCELGQPMLLARGGAIAGEPVEDMIPADGRSLTLASNTALFSIYGTFYGGDGKSTFNVPNIAAPVPDSGWYICTDGVYPQQSDIGVECPVGEVDFFALPNFPIGSINDPNWLPADGRTVNAGPYPLYASVYGAEGNGTIRLPSVSAPPGLTSYVCVNGMYGAMPDMGELALYPPLPAGSPLDDVWTLANGSSVSVNANEPLAAILGDFDGPTFALPNVPATGVSGASWYIATEGVWPFG